MELREFYERAEAELNRARRAEKEKNYGMSRVCARRAVGIMVEAWMTLEPDPLYGTHAMSALRGLSEDEITPQRIKDAANRLRHGIRAIGTDLFPQSPIQDAEAIIAYLQQRLQHKE